MEIFIGRFHPLVVHLPIGFLLLTAVMQGLVSFKIYKYEKLDLAIQLTLLLGGISSVLAAFIGWLLSSAGGYDQGTLFWHQWLGISVAILCFLGWFVKLGIIQLKNTIHTGLIGLIVITVSVTGHLGGNLTHGDDYLIAYAPSFIRDIFLEGEEKSKKELPLLEDSIVLYKHLIEPILDSKCYSCHNESKLKGGLILTSVNDILKGGDTGPGLSHGNALKSLLYQRVTLPSSNKKFMPPKGDPLTYSEIELLRWWIENDADESVSITEASSSKTMKNLLERDYGLDISPKALTEKLSAPLLKQEAIDKIRESGFNINPLSYRHTLYEVTFGGSSLSMEQLESLLLAKEQITKISISRKDLTDEMLSVFSQMPNLTFLRLDQNPITDAGIFQLKPLKNLETLNLYGTQITDKSVENISVWPNLKSMYVWRTEVSQKRIEESSVLIGS
ncbi:MAG: leucine-rich repeat domain-containing protein [Reichenbachiella sp.]